MSKVLVGVKRVIDYNAKIRLAGDAKGVELKQMKFSMNPFCEIAVEEAVRMKEKKLADEIVVVSIGPKQSQEVIRTAMAMGADRGIHIITDKRIDQEVEPLAVAKIMKHIVEKESPNVILMGKQSIDGDSNQVGQMLAGLLDYPQITFASEIELDGDKATVRREIDGGIQTLSANLPAVFTADLRLNEPRYSTLPNIMKAKKKKMETIKIEDLDIDVTPRNQVLKVSEPPKRQAGIIVESIDGLIDKLKNEAKVL